MNADKSMSGGSELVEVGEYDGQLATGHWQLIAPTCGRRRSGAPECGRAVAESGCR